MRARVEAEWHRSERLLLVSHCSELLGLSH